MEINNIKKVAAKKDNWTWVWEFISGKEGI